MSNPNKSYYKSLNRIWGYLKRFPDLGVFYTTKDIKDLLLIGYTDSSWADDLEKR